MFMQLLRRVVVSTLVLGAFATLSDVVLAEDKPVTINFSCTVPAIGSERCGDPDVNVRVGPARRLNIKIDEIPQSYDKKICVTFTVYHAVTHKELATSGELCEPGQNDRTWTNPKDESIDVYMKVKSTVVSEIKIVGRYIMVRP